MNFNFVKIAFQLICILILTGLEVNSEEESRIDLGKTLKLNRAFENTKFILTPARKTKKIFQQNLDKIKNECCEENFQNFKEVEEIKNILQDCLNEKCEKYMFPIFNPKKPPKKLVGFRLINKIDDLILENEKFKYNKLTKKLDINQSERLKNEKDVNILKKSLKEIEIENKNLRKTVDKMLIKYESKISKLEKSNEELQNDFQKAYDMLSKSKQKKFDKK